MALWKDPATTPSATAPTPSTPAPQAAREPERVTPMPASADAARRTAKAEPKESVIAADLAIEGKIEGSGHVRIAGRFKGDVHVDGNLTIESGAHLTGQVYARNIVVAGELHGNVAGAARVEVVDSGLVSGDIKAGTVTVAAGARMRGQVEFGWEEKDKGVKSIAAS
jgi:cytoskeletal protein CcmA (bactofilin family)